MLEVRVRGIPPVLPSASASATFRYSFPESLWDTFLVGEWTIALRSFAAISLSGGWMGVELISHNSQAGNLHYSWKGWCWIREFARENGIDTGEFAEYNDGDELGAAACQALASAIERHESEYNKTFGGGCYGSDPAKEHARVWRESSGFEQ